MNDFHPMSVSSVILDGSPTLAIQVVVTVLEKKLATAKRGEDRKPHILSEDSAESDKTVRTVTFQPKVRYDDLLKETNDFYELPMLAEAAPRDFLDGVWPWFIDVLKCIVRPPHHTLRKYREGESSLCDTDEHVSVVNPIMDAIELAIKSVAKESPTYFDDFLDQWREFDSLLLQKLLCRGVAVRSLQRPELGVSYLTEDMRRLHLGSYLNKHRDSSDLLGVLGEVAGDEGIRSLEVAIVGWTEYVGAVHDDHVDFRRRRAKWDRVSRLELLESLPFNRLSMETRATIEAERTALVKENAVDGRVDRRRGRWRRADSPMTTDQMAKARNEHIIHLFNELIKRSSEDDSQAFRRGGISEAVHAFGEFSKNLPYRAKSILLLLSPDRHELFVANAIRRLSESELPTAELHQLILGLEMKQFVGSDFRSCAARALGERAEQEHSLSGEMTELLEKWLSEWTEFDCCNDDQENDSEGDAQSVLWRPGPRDVLPEGTYSILRTLKCGYLQEEPPNYNAWIACLERHLDRPSIDLDRRTSPS